MLILLYRNLRAQAFGCGNCARSAGAFILSNGGDWLEEDIFGACADTASGGPSGTIQMNYRQFNQHGHGFSLHVEPFREIDDHSLQSAGSGTKKDFNLNQGRCMITI